MAPIGYVNERGKGIMPHPEFSGLIKKIFEQYATGNFTLKNIREKFNALGLRGKSNNGLAVSNYQTILKNPIYTGMMRHNGELCEGKHEPIISKKLFDDVQEVMTRKSKPKTNELKSYAYRGLFHCGECGCFITTETKKGHNYLRCTKRKGPCNQKYLREEIMTEQIRDELKKVSLSDTVADWLITENEKDKSENDRLMTEQTKKVTGEIAILDAKLDKIMTAYLENALTLPEYQETKNKLMLEKHALNDKLSSLARVSSSRFEPVKNFLEDCKQAAIVADGNDPSKLRDFLKKVGSNPLLRDRALVFSPRAPFAFVSEIAQNASNYAGGAAGGVWGGMPPRPPRDERSEAQLLTEHDFVVLRCSRVKYQ
jgi:hypothetical protein